MPSVTQTSAMPPRNSHVTLDVHPSLATSHVTVTNARNG
jgi:hypothetical protein